jgi:hypothetical protein
MLTAAMLGIVAPVIELVGATLRKVKSTDLYERDAQRVVFVQSPRAPGLDLEILVLTAAGMVISLQGELMLVRLVLLGAAATMGFTILPQDSPIERARWLAGCWELRGQNRLTVEMWMPPAGGLMLGASRTVVGGSAREFEHLRLKAEGPSLSYIALPSGQRETTFPSKHLSDTLLVFENLQHDFPQRILYRRVGADSLVARIEGPGPNNTTRGFNFPMQRASCDA